MKRETTTEKNAHNLKPAAGSKACERCGKLIAAARLEALPEATTCIECAKKHPKPLDTSFVEISEASPINRNGFAPKD